MIILSRSAPSAEMHGAEEELHSRFLDITGLY